MGIKEKGEINVIMHKKEFVMTGELVPDGGRMNVWEFMQEKFRNQEHFDILIPEHEESEYILMQSIYVLGDYKKGDAVIQCEQVVLCFDSQKLYTSLNNLHPEQEWFDKVSNIYSNKQLKAVGYPTVEGIPTRMPTAFSQMI